MSNENNLKKGIVYEKKEFSDEEKEKFKEEYLLHIANLIEYIENEPRRPTSRSKMELLAFCMLSAIDGESGSLNGFRLIPIVDEEECGYKLPDILDNFDIAGSLHDNLQDYLK